MKTIPAQNSYRLLIPMGALALAAGIACGVLLVVMMWVSVLLESAGDSSTGAGLGGFWLEYGLFAVYAALIGAGVALLPGIGAYVAVAIQDAKNPGSSGTSQALWAACGASSGSLLPALGLLALWVSDPVDNTILYLAAGFVLFCFALTFVLMYLLLGWLQLRDRRTVKNGSVVQRI
ncbi:hypothetical protein [Glutamicibacter arilaitensis]|uniref:hypothetical protein n=1 Tax=Glutamicibacter arilaitensis TaxID=256701 RepID=UPI00384B2C6D